LAPSITETLFALGIGDRVVGVTRYCDYPPEAKEKEDIGGYIDPNYEAMIAIKPDLVVMLEEHEEPRKFMEERQIAVLVLNHKDIAGIIDSIEKIGAACGESSRALEVVTRINSTLESIKNKTRGLERPRVMITVGRNFGAEGLEDVYIAGKGGFYDEMIDLAGGVNAYTDEKVKYPKVSSEGIIMMDPQVIVDIIPDIDEQQVTKEDVMRQWQSLSGVSAVKNGRIHLMTQDYAVIPGPRFINILDDLARLIHPELDWEKQ
jgi:iron complex transport system substrate-binding protein